VQRIKQIKKIKTGDFTGLAYDYSKYRPNYSASVLEALLGLFCKPVSEIDFVDVGAGTGIWSRMVSNKLPKTITAIEPNQDMRKLGMLQHSKNPIRWLEGCAENTSLPNNSVDWLTMASSFHWVDFKKAINEFHRVLRPNGHFTALWNPRLIEVNPLLVEIEEYLKKLNPKLKRISSGRSGITETLTERLLSSNLFEDVIYIEGRHIIKMTRERYMGAWRSVNDIHAQIGNEKFDLFLDFINTKIAGLDFIEATYLTRSWSAKRKN